MELKHLTMPPFNTTLIGVLKGVAAYFGLTHSDPMLFGASGHAFLINIHDQVCPSSPYCWDASGFDRLIGNLGVRRTGLGFFELDSSAKERGRVEARLRSALDQGIPCALLNLENQLITGYDGTGFFTAQPWPHMNFPPAHLSFGTWQELGKEVHIGFYTYEQCAADPRTAIIDSLDYAVDLARDPRRYRFAGYHIGPEAYAHWRAAIPEYGASHGQWWNATVWSECRRMAAAYFAEIGDRFPAASEPATSLVHAYTEVADLLSQVRDKDMAAKDKIAVIDKAASAEAHAIEQIAALATQLRGM